MISTREMAEALRRSGYLLEQRVFGLLDERGYYVQTNTPYPDEFTGKSRELDVNALWCYDVGAYDILCSVFLCSCVNNSQPLAFFTQESPVPFMHHVDLKMSGLPVKVRDDSEDRDLIQLAAFLNLDRYHHYRQPRISTQYCSFAPKKSKQQSQKPEWMATHIEEHFDSTSALGVATEAEISKHYEIWRDPVVRAEADPNMNIQVYYRVLVLQGDLYDVRVAGSELDIFATEHVLFRHGYHSAQRRDEYFIDVVTESYLPAYLDLVEREMERMARAIRRRKKALRESMRVMLRAVKRTGKVRQVFEWKE